MVLDKIPGTKLFVQRDVRETPAATATASAVGLTGEPYVLVSAGGADLTAERVLTAGEGIDLSDGGAGTTITVSGEDSTAANKGIVIVAGTANEITCSYASGTATLSLTNKTSYLSIPGTSFIADAGTNFSYDDGAIYNSNGTTYGFASVNLPHGAIVTGAIVYGSDATETWALLRQTIGGTGAGTGMATANIGTTDSTISNATIDNSTYKYYILTSELDTNDSIYGAKITYTTDYV